MELPELSQLANSVSSLPERNAIRNFKLCDHCQRSREEEAQFSMGFAQCGFDLGGRCGSPQAIQPVDVGRRLIVGSATATGLSDSTAAVILLALVIGLDS